MLAGRELHSIPKIWLNDGGWEFNLMLNLDFLIKEGVLEERVRLLGCLLGCCWLQEEVVVAGLGQLGAVGLQEGGGELQRVQVHHQVRAQLPVTQPGAKVPTQKKVGFPT